MDAENREEFFQVLIGMAEIKSKEMTTEAFEIWWNAMQAWEISEFKKAAGYLLKNCQFMPTPYDFEQLRKKGETSAHEAWATVLAHAEGPWRKGVLGDALTDRAVGMLGGYRVIALTDKDKLGFLERRFLDHYNDFQDTQDVREALPNLSERPRLQNGSAVRIGEVEINKQIPAINN